MTLRYPVVLVREGKKHWAYIPDMPGVYGLGTTATRAKKSLVEALKLYIEDCRAEGDPITITSRPV